MYVVHTDEIGDQALASTQVFPGVVGLLAWARRKFLRWQRPNDVGGIDVDLQPWLHKKSPSLPQYRIPDPDANLDYLSKSLVRLGRMDLWDLSSSLQYRGQGLSLSQPHAGPIKELFLTLLSARATV